MKLALLVPPRVVASALPGGAAPGNDALFPPRVVASVLPGGAAPGNDALWAGR